MDFEAVNQKTGSWPSTFRQMQLYHYDYSVSALPRSTASPLTILIKASLIPGPVFCPALEILIRHSYFVLAMKMCKTEMCHEPVNISQSADAERLINKLFLTVAGSGKSDKNPSQHVYAWRLETSEGHLIKTNVNDKAELSTGSINLGLYSAQKQALKYARGMQVKLLAPQSELAHVHSCTVEERRIKRYRRSNKKPYTNKIAIQEVDDLAEAYGIELSFQTPSTPHEIYTLEILKEAASALYHDATSLGAKNE